MKFNFQTSAMVVISLDILHIISFQAAARLTRYSPVTRELSQVEWSKTVIVQSFKSGSFIIVLS